MKKTAILCLLLGITLVFSPNVYASVDFYRGVENGLGCSINLLDADDISINNVEVGQPVLSSSFFNNATITETNPNASLTLISDGFTFEDYYEKMQLNYQNNTELSGKKGPLSVSAKVGFTSGTTLEHSEYGSQYFYNQSYKDTRYSLVIQNYKSNLSQFSNNLNDNYISFLSYVDDGYFTWQYFFDTYGTHLIAEADYGAKLDMYYSVCSNKLVLDETYSAEITAEIEAGLSDAENGSTSSTIDLTNIDHIEQGDVSKAMFIKAIGGDSFSTSDLSQYAESYSAWVDSISKYTSTLIGVSDDGLIPLWDILPSQYRHLAYEMESAYNDIALTKYNSTRNYFESAQIFATEYEMIRTTSKLITDSGRFNQHYDKVDLGDANINFDVLKLMGYKYVNIDIIFDHKEVNDGYQYFFIFKSSLESNEHLIHTQQFEHVPGSKDKTYITEEFNLNAISIDQFSGKTFIIRWGASGSFNDDWYNKNLQVRVSITK